MHIKFDLEIYGTYLKWLSLDLGSKRYTVYRDLDGKLAREVTAKPKAQHVTQER